MNKTDEKIRSDFMNYHGLEGRLDPTNIVRIGVIRKSLGPTNRTTYFSMLFELTHQEVSDLYQRDPTFLDAYVLRVFDFKSKEWKPVEDRSRYKISQVA